MCIGLSEVMASAGKSQMLSFMDELIPTIRTALCDRFLISVVSLVFVPFKLYKKITSVFLFLLTVSLRFVSQQAWHSILSTR